jgi:hypothetical protein
MAVRSPSELKYVEGGNRSCGEGKAQNPEVINPDQ